MSAPHITQLRQHLLETLADLRNRETPMEPDRARAVAQVAGVLVESAKVEVEYLKATHQSSAPFLETPPNQLYIGQGSMDSKRLPTPPGNGINSVTQYGLKG